MGYLLPNGLSFCVTSKRAVFLDVRRDRYFCLGAKVERSFLGLVDDGHLTLPALELARLVACGLIEQVAGDARPQPCLAMPIPRASLLDSKPGPITPALVANAAFELAKARAILKLRGLAASLEAVRGVRSKSDPGGAADRASIPVAHAFAQTGLFAATHNQCLPRSLAVARAMLRRGLRASVFLGVRLEPFRAHCWVQDGDLLINDHLDVVRDFTPILIV